MVNRFTYWIDIQCAFFSSNTTSCWWHEKMACT